MDEGAGAPGRVEDLPVDRGGIRRGGRLEGDPGDEAGEKAYDHGDRGRGDAAAQPEAHVFLP